MSVSRLQPARDTAEPTHGVLASSEVLAAVDLGSNSFHMVVARLSHGQLTVVDRLREMVRLAAGLGEDSRLDRASRERALTCLSRFGERIRDMHADRVRVVGTNTLRKAKKTGDFLMEAQDRLGHPVEIISGIEEARLVYLGASHSMPLIDGPQIVVDIGGGSTEIIRGYGYEPEAMESLYLGCVSLSTACFAGGKLTARRFERARLAARLELQPVKARFRSVTPARFVGGSGTIRAASAVLAALEGTAAGLTGTGLEKLIQLMIAAGRIDKLHLDGLSEQRKPVFPGGIAMLVEVMSALGMDRMVVADGALREGILYDMVGRLSHEDARLRSVRSMEARFHVDTEQAARVEQSALRLLEQVATDWKLDKESDGLSLSWAARLHEIGLDIAHAHYHRHGAYLLENADMPGFTREEQRILACLVGSHRRNFNRGSFDGIASGSVRRTMRLAVLLRLAVLFNRSRTSADPAPFRCHASGRRLNICIPTAWLEANTLTLADLEREEESLAGAGFEMTLERSD
jgi:exopolyphosphatase/guanosine-5'-triphosphate,3'-diphosphate pyrophosphatase